MSLANRLLILDDDPGVLHFLGEVGRLCRYEVALTGSTAELRAIYDTFDPSMILMDLRYDQGDAIEVMSYLTLHRCRVPIVLVSGVDERVLDAARRVGLEQGLSIVGVTPKPVSMDTLAPLLEAHRQPEVDEWSDALRGALDRDEIVVEYQPKARLSDGQPVGFEALARWHHPTRGVVSPDQFIPMADAVGLMTPLTVRVLNRAIATCAAWIAAGHDLGVAINIPASSLTCERLPDEIAQILETHGLAANRVTLEVTESAAMHDPVLSLEVLSRLRLRGLHLSLDDFGTGYSNLHLLHRMPFTELKIDKSFISEIEANRDSQVIVRALVALASQLGLTTVAEGIEELAVCAWLRSVGVEQVQGYAIARPMPADEVSTWLKGRSRIEAPQHEV
jgi:EAL domain-containing protein (putative c-di-GMP-specific phosphodiesterase class I)